MSASSYTMSQRLQSAKRAFVTRRVDSNDLQGLNTNQSPKSGDLVLARVTEIGHHTKIERIDGRKATLYEGDEIILAFGNRYAPDQFEATVPNNLDACHMVAAGGIAGLALGWHSRISVPTAIQPIGLITNKHDQVINVADYKLPSHQYGLVANSVPSVVVVGTSMNAGKTTTAAHLIHGLNAAGHTVGAMKITGTGAGGDLWLMKDSGAAHVLDFTDAGYPTSFNIGNEQAKQIYPVLAAELIRKGCTAIVIEVADGIYQQETNAILESPDFKQHFPNVLFTAREAMGALSGASWLVNQGYNVQGIGGRICASPLATREAANALGMTVYDLADLRDPTTACYILGTDAYTSGTA